MTEKMEERARMMGARIAKPFDLNMVRHSLLVKCITKALLDFHAQESKDLIEATSDLEDIQDHEDWCGHGKAGCLFCKVLRRILEALKPYSDTK